jgi:hypothetical protein
MAARQPTHLGLKAPLRNLAVEGCDTIFCSVHPECERQGR